MLFFYNILSIICYLTITYFINVSAGVEWLARLKPVDYKGAEFLKRMYELHNESDWKRVK